MLRTLNAGHLALVAVHENGVEAPRGCLLVLVFAWQINVNRVDDSDVSWIDGMVILTHELDSVVKGKALKW
jgi:hypothetical protein